MIATKKRILIAEDNRALGQVMKFNLERAGFEVNVVCDGQQAIEELRENPCDLLITDLEMPVVGGAELCGVVRQELGMSDLPIAVCSARGYELCIYDLVVKWNLSQSFYKPVSPQAIVEFVRTALQPESTCVATIQ